MEKVKEKPVDVWHRIGNIDKRIIWWLLSILVAIILIRPVGLPISISQPTRDYLDIIKALPEGSVVLFEISTTAYAWDETGWGAYATAKVLLERGIKMIILGVQVPDSGVLSQMMIERAGWDTKAIYGEDYVNLGFLAGGEITLLNLAKNFQFAGKDIDGTPLSELSLTKNIVDANDIDLIIDIASAGGVGTWYMRHWTIPYGTTFIEIAASASIHGVAPFYESGECSGYLPGGKGCAEFEYLTGKPSGAIKMLDAQSVIHFYFIGLVILGNLALVAERRKR